MGFRDLKCRNGVQNWNLREKLSKTGPVEKFWLWSKSMVNDQSQWSTVRVNDQSQRSTDEVCWRGSVMSSRAYVAGREAQQARGACGTSAWGCVRSVADTGGACLWGRNFSRHVEARVMQFLAVLGWVLLGIGCSIFLCLFFGSWIHRMLISGCCRYCGHDNGGSLLTVTTRWRRGQRKNARDVHKNQKVRGMALIPC